MSDVVKSALITVSGMVLVVLVTEVLRMRGDERKRAQMFFKDFFPVRLQAHQEIMRTISKFAVQDLDPEIEGIASIKKALKDFSDAILGLVNLHGITIGKDIMDSLGELYFWARRAMDAEEEPSELEHMPFEEVLCKLQSEYHKFVELLGEKSGVDIIDREFGKALESLDCGWKATWRNLCKRVARKEKRPQEGV